MDVAQKRPLADNGVFGLINSAANLEVLRRVVGAHLKSLNAPEGLVYELFAAHGQPSFGEDVIRWMFNDDINRAREIVKQARRFSHPADVQKAWTAIVPNFDEIHDIIAAAVARYDCIKKTMQVPLDTDSKGNIITAVVVRDDGVFISSRSNVAIDCTYHRVIAVPIYVVARYESLNGPLWTIRAGDKIITGDLDKIRHELRRHGFIVNRNRATDVISAILSAYGDAHKWAAPAVGVFERDGRLMVYLPDSGPIAPPMPNKYAEQLYAILKRVGWSEDAINVAKRTWLELLTAHSNPDRLLGLIGLSLASAVSYAVKPAIRLLPVLVGPHGGGKTTDGRIITEALFGGPVLFKGDALGSESRIATLVSITTAPILVDEVRTLTRPAIEALKAVSSGSGAHTFRKTVTQDILESLPLSVPILTLNDGAEWLNEDLDFLRSRVALITYPSPPRSISERQQWIERGLQISRALEELMRLPPLGWVVLRGLDGVAVGDLRNEARETAQRIIGAINLQDPRRADFYGLSWILFQRFAAFVGIDTSWERWLAFVRSIETTKTADVYSGDLELWIETLRDLQQSGALREDGYLYITAETLRLVNDAVRRGGGTVYKSLPALARAIAMVYGFEVDELYTRSAWRVNGKKVKAVRIPIELLDSDTPESSEIVVEHIDLASGDSSKTSTEREMVKLVVNVIRDLNRKYDAVDVDAIKRELQSFGLSEEEITSALDWLKQDGTISEVKPGLIRLSEGVIA